MPDRSPASLAPPWPHRRATLRATLTTVLAVILAGCAVAASPAPSGSTAGPTSAPAGTTGPSAGGASPSAPTGPAPSASLASQTDTAWGRIWDDLPVGFPRYPGAANASIGRGPLSAEFTVAADPAAVLTALRTALEAAGFTTVSLSGPLEDGSRTLNSAGGTAGCRVQTTVGQLGGLTYIAVLFGAACPYR